MRQVLAKKLTAVTYKSSKPFKNVLSSDKYCTMQHKNKTKVSKRRLNFTKLQMHAFISSICNIEASGCNVHVNPINAHAGNVAKLLFYKNNSIPFCERSLFPTN